MNPELERLLAALEARDNASPQTFLLAASEVERLLTPILERLSQTGRADFLRALQRRAGGAGRGEGAHPRRHLSTLRQQAGDELSHHGRTLDRPPRGSPTAPTGKDQRMNSRRRPTPRADWLCSALTAVPNDPAAALSVVCMAVLIDEAGVIEQEALVDLVAYVGPYILPNPVPTGRPPLGAPC